MQMQYNVAQTPGMWYNLSMESILYICRLCLKTFRSHGWATRHEEGCVGAIQVVMLDGPQTRAEILHSVVQPEAR